MVSPLVPNPNVTPGNSGGGETLNDELPNLSVPEPPKPTFSIPYAELKPVRLYEPRHEDVQLEEKTHQLLTDTLVAHFETIDKLPQANRPSNVEFRGFFYETFKRKYPGVDFSKEEELRKVAGEFMRSGEGVRTAMKLAEWEMATLQRATGRVFEVVKTDKSKKLYEGGEQYFLTAEGLTPTKGELGLRQKLQNWTGWGLSQEIFRYRLKFIHGNQMVTAHLTPEQQEFLGQCEWRAGPLNTEQEHALDARLVSITTLREELLRKTGVPLTEIQRDLNFVVPDPPSILGVKYAATKTAHFVGERGALGANVREILEAEGVQIVTEVKTKVEQELKEAIEKAQKENVAAETTRQIEAEATRIKEEADLDKDDVDEKKKGIEVEITKLEDERSLIKKRKAIDADITEATKVRDETKAALGARALQIGVTLDDLMKWSGDITENESLVKAQQKIDELLIEQEKVQTERKELIDQIEVHSKHEIKGQTVTIKDTAGNITQQPTPAAEKAWEAWAKEYEELRNQIRTLDYKFRHDNWPGEGKPLPEAIRDLKKVVLQRKNIIEDAATKEMVDNYRNAEKTLKDKQTDKIDTETKVASLLAAAPQVPLIGAVPAHQPSEDERLTQIKKAIKEKQKEIEKVDVGLPAEAKLLTSALTALAPVYSSDGSTRIENNLAQKERGLFLFEPGPDWNAYPDSINAFIQLVWGKDVLSTHPSMNKETVDQIKSLMSSKEYLDVIITTIEASAGIPIPNPTHILTQGIPREGAYTDITNLFTGTTLRSLSATNSLDIMNRDVVQKIIENMRKKALRLP